MPIKFGASKMPLNMSKDWKTLTLVRPILQLYSPSLQVVFRFIKEPTTPDNILGHVVIPKALAPHGTGVATGEYAHNHMIFKQLLQVGAVNVCQINLCKLAEVTEILSVLLMSKNFSIPVCPHAGGVRLCEYALHLKWADLFTILLQFSKADMDLVLSIISIFMDP